MMSERELAQLVAESVKAVTAPILVDVKTLQAALGSWELRWNDLGALRERLAVLEVRAQIPGPPGERGPTGERGERGTPGEPGMHGKDGADGVSIKGDPGERGEKGDPGLNGKDGAPGLDGKDGVPGLNGKDGAAGVNGKDGAQGLPGKDGAAGLNGKDGAPGLNGKDGLPGLQGKDGVDGANGKDGADGLHGKDGAGVVDAMLDRTGQLVLTLSNGQTKTVGLVVGKDGANGQDGQPGRDVDPLLVKEFLTGELAKWPRPKDGQDGRDGTDGFGFEDLSLVFDEMKGWAVRFSRQDLTKDFPVPIPFDAGVWRPGRQYPAGAGVTVKGAWWIAQQTTSVRPGDENLASRSWRLAVRGGKDGKPGRDGRVVEEG